MKKQVSSRSWWGMVLGILLLWSWVAVAGQETCKFGVHLEVISVSTNYPQKGFLPFILTNGEPKIFLKKKIEFTADFVQSGTGGSNPDPAYEESYQLELHQQYMDELVYPVGSSQLILTNYSGSVSRLEMFNLQPNLTYSNSISSIRTNGSWSNPSYAFQPGNIPLSIVSESVMQGDHGIARSATMGTNGAITSFTPDPFPDATEEYPSTYLADMFYRQYQSMHWGTVSVADSYNCEVTLSSPVVLTGFVSQALSQIQSAAYPTNGQATARAKASYLGVPLVADGADSGTFDPEVSKFKFRIAYRGAKGEKGTIRWKYTTNTLSAATGSSSTNFATVKEFSQEVTFDGTCQYIDWQEVLPPSSFGSVELELLNEERACQPCTLAGIGKGYMGSVGYEVSLGRRGDGKSAGELFIQEETAGAGLATPAVLQKFFSPYVKVVETNGVIRQASAPDCVVDVVTVSTNKFEVRFYTQPDYNAGPGTNGLFTITGTLFKTWVFEGTSGGGLKISEGVGGGAKVWDFVPINNGWRLVEPGGETVNERINQTVNGNRVESTSIKDDEGNLVYFSEREWKTVAGVTGELLIRETEGSGGAARSTHYTFYESAGAGFGQLKLSVFPDGNWERLEYATNANLVVKRVTPFKNAETNAADNLCRVVEYSYVPVTDLDNGQFYADQPRTTTEYVLGTAVAKSYQVFTGKEIWSIKAWRPDAAWTHNSNHKTVTRVRTSIAGLTDETVLPDGVTQTSREVVDPATGYRTNTVTSLRAASGNAGTGNGMIVKVMIWLGDAPAPTSKESSLGTKTVSVTSPSGWPVSQKTYELFSHGDVLVDQVTYSNVDAQFGPRTVTYFDGSSESTEYDCCGVTARTDRNGVETVYAYDANRRLVSTTRLGITTTQIKDAAGMVRSTVRTGTDATEIIVGRAAYDTAGRQLYSVDALGNTNSVTEAFNGSGELVRTTTYPNGGTVIETHFKDGSLKSVTGTATYGEAYDYGVGTLNSAPVQFTKVEKLNNGVLAGEWVKSYTDTWGRQIRTEYADGTVESSNYNSKGQLTKSVERTGRVLLYQYTAAGDLEFTVVDMDRDGVIDWAGSDQITQSVASVVSAHGTAVRRSETYVWEKDKLNYGRLVGISDQSLDGQQAWQIVGSVTNHTSTEQVNATTRRVTQTRSDGSPVVQEHQSGRLVSVKRKDANGVQLGLTTFGYDAHGRRNTVTDARNGTSTLYFNAGDLVTTNLTVVPGPGLAAQKTVMKYDNLGRVYETVLPDGTVVNQEFHLTGELKRSYGSRTYPVYYDYDYAGRLKLLKTWREAGAEGTAAVTTWQYETNSGNLTGKTYADSRAVGYGWTNGVLSQRTWARGSVVNYGYDAAGRLTQMDYADGMTADVVVEYDRAGRRRKVHQGPAGTGRETVEYDYTEFGAVAGQRHTSGVLAGLALTNRYDGHYRRVQVGVQAVGTGLYTVGYGYDAGSRLGWVTNGSSVISYGYHTNSALVRQVTFKHGGTTRLTTTKEYDGLNRLSSIENGSGASGADAWGYEYNEANQRRTVRLADGSYWEYQYDKLGQVVSGKKYARDGTSLPGQQFGYGFDDIGNRVVAEREGEAGAYVVNGVNQYQQRTVPGILPVVGKATPYVSVLVNSNAAGRLGDYWWKVLSVNNASGAVAQAVSVTATVPGGTNTASASGMSLVPPRTEFFAHDEDGNLKEDGLWIYTWDGENRLVGMQAKAWGGSTLRLTLSFGYDWMGRRIRKTVRNGGVVTAETWYVYDGWNLVAELGKYGLVKSYTWGLDLSGSLQGAGGVGGLLALSTHTNNTVTGTHYAGYDGNGNVTVLVNATNGLWSGQYEYGPFGEPLRVSGTAARENPFRFSTKYEDGESGLLYYGYRYYNPSTGRWLSRDPIGESGGENVFAFVFNNGQNLTDYLGESAQQQLASSFWGALLGNGNWVSDGYDDWDEFEKETTEQLATAVVERLKTVAQGKGTPLHDLEAGYIAVKGVVSSLKDRGFSETSKAIAPNLHEVVTSDEWTSRATRKATVKLGIQVALLFGPCKKLDKSAVQRKVGQAVDQAVKEVKPPPLFPPLPAAAKTPARIHGNSLSATGPHDVYVIRDRITGRIYHFGETGRGFETRGAEWVRKLRKKYRLDTVVEHLRTVEGKAAARALESRYIEIYEKVFGIKPGYVDDAGNFIKIQKGRH